jgi:hypothetical protein
MKVGQLRPRSAVFRAARGGRARTLLPYLLHQNRDQLFPSDELSIDPRKWAQQTANSSQSMRAQMCV